MAFCLKKKMKSLSIYLMYQFSCLHSEDHGPKRFKREFRLFNEIGRGGFGVVYRGHRVSDGMPLAIKFIPHKCVGRWTMVGKQMIPTEIHRLEQCQSVKGVVRLIDWFASSRGFWLVMERPENCMDLFDVVSIYGRLDESSARGVFTQLLDTVLSLKEDLSIIHRDIKDENIVVDMDTGQIRLIDFGAAEQLDQTKEQRFQGTRSYCPPEWFKNQLYLPLEATVWSLGVLLYIMVVGTTPFRNEIQICLGRLRFPEFISEDCQSLIRRCLCVAPEGRIPLDAIRQHPWMARPLERYSRSRRFHTVLHKRSIKRLRRRGSGWCKEDDEGTDEELNYAEEEEDSETECTSYRQNLDVPGMPARPISIPSHIIEAASLRQNSPNVDAEKLLLELQGEEVEVEENSHQTASIYDNVGALYDRSYTIHLSSSSCASEVPETRERSKSRDERGKSESSDEEITRRSEAIQDIRDTFRLQHQLEMEFQRNLRASINKHRSHKNKESEEEEDEAFESTYDYDDDDADSVIVAGSRRDNPLLLLASDEEENESLQMCKSSDDVKLYSNNKEKEGRVKKSFGTMTEDIPLSRKLSKLPPVPPEKPRRSFLITSIPSEALLSPPQMFCGESSTTTITSGIASILGLTLTPDIIPGTTSECCSVKNCDAEKMELRRESFRKPRGSDASELSSIYYSAAGTPKHRRTLRGGKTFDQQQQKHCSMKNDVEIFSTPNQEIERHPTRYSIPPSSSPSTSSSDSLSSSNSSSLFDDHKLEAEDELSNNINMAEAEEEQSFYRNGEMKNEENDEDDEDDRTMLADLPHFIVAPESIQSAEQRQNGIRTFASYGFDNTKNDLNNGSAANKSIAAPVQPWQPSFWSLLLPNVIPASPTSKRSDDGCAGGAKPRPKISTGLVSRLIAQYEEGNPQKKPNNVCCLLSSEALKNEEENSDNSSKKQQKPRSKGARNLRRLRSYITIFQKQQYADKREEKIRSKSEHKEMKADSLQMPNNPQIMASPSSEKQQLTSQQTQKVDSSEFVEEDHHLRQSSGQIADNFSFHVHQTDTFCSSDDVENSPNVNVNERKHHFRQQNPQKINEFVLNPLEDREKSYQRIQQKPKIVKCNRIPWPLVTDDDIRNDYADDFSETEQANFSTPVNNNISNGNHQMLRSMPTMLTAA